MTSIFSFSFVATIFLSSWTQKWNKVICQSMLGVFLVNIHWDWHLISWWFEQLELQYLHDYAGLSSSVGLTANPIVNFSGVIGTNAVALGTDLSFDTKTGNFTKCNAGLSFSNADLIASLILWVFYFVYNMFCFQFTCTVMVNSHKFALQIAVIVISVVVTYLIWCMMYILLYFSVIDININCQSLNWWCRNDKADTLSASYYHIVNPLNNTAVGAEVTHSFSTNENTITVGTQHALDPLTSVKARVNNFGKASALVQHEWRPKSLFTISGEVDTKAIEKSAKIGLALALKPWVRILRDVFGTGKVANGSIV